MGFFDTLFNSPLRIQLAEFLSSEMIFGLDWWTLLHFASGILIMYFIFNYRLEKRFKLNKYWILFFGLLMFELLEFYWFKTSNRFFTQETLMGQGFDIFVGCLGAIVFRRKNE